MKTLWSVVFLWLVPGFALLVLSSSVQAQNQPTVQKLPELPSACEAFCDLLLSVQEMKTEPNGTLVLRAAALYKHEPVALRITFAAGMGLGSMNVQTGNPDIRSLARGGIHFQSIGPESDHLIVALAKLYQSKIHPKAMDEDIHFDAYAAQGNPEDLQHKEVLFRIFHAAPGTDGMQCELLLNVNLPRNEIRLREVDQDYRDFIIRFLSRPEP